MHSLFQERRLADDHSLTLPKETGKEMNWALSFYMKIFGWPLFLLCRSLIADWSVFLSIKRISLIWLVSFFLLALIIFSIWYDYRAKKKDNYRAIIAKDRKGKANLRLTNKRIRRSRKVGRLGDPEVWWNWLSIETTHAYLPFPHMLFLWNPLFLPFSSDPPTTKSHVFRSNVFGSRLILCVCIGFWIS